MKPLSQLIRKADKVFSEYVRRRDAENDMVSCCTCGSVKHWKEMHCGHFQSRRHKAIRWEEKNTNSQCSGCNTFRNGEQFKFARYLDSRYGEGTAEEMERRRNDKAPGRLEIEEIIKKYSEKLKDLK